MKFSEFRNYQPKSNSTVIGFVCGDDFLVDESRTIWDRIFGGNWLFEKVVAKEFQEIPAARIRDEALTPSLFSQNRVFIVTGADKLLKARMEELAEMQSIPNSSLKVLLVADSRKSIAAWPKTIPCIEIDELKPADAARWIVDRYKVGAEIARYLVENLGTELYQLDSEIRKLQTYAGGRALEVRDIDVLILRSEQFGPFELGDALLSRNYRRAVEVVGAMMENGWEPLQILRRIVIVWRQLLIGKALAGKRSANDVAAAAGVLPFKSGDFAAACKKYEWKRIAGGFRELLKADRAFKNSTPNAEGYLDVMLWKLIA